jgi:enamine deaminase RidA (YjgF/YER057c/UK114 family)
MMHHSFVRHAGSAAEWYLTIRPESAEETTQIFAHAATVLRAHGASILHERIFAQSDDLSSLAVARRAAYGELDDGVDPTWLTSPAGRGGRCAAVQIHAIAGGGVPLVRGRHMRVFPHESGGIVTVSAQTAPGSHSVPEQCSVVFNSTVTELADVGVTMHHLARTWLWLDPIYTWYPDLNRIRNRCFTVNGLIAADGKAMHLPASTGIGLHPAGNAAFALEAIATLGSARPATLAVAGNQRSAFGYGSAFSRAACLNTPSGETWYVSGTAAIDAEGRTVAIGDIAQQVSLTIDNVRAVLSDIEANEQDIVQGVAYCLTPAVEAAWIQAASPWPLAVVQADICRSNLLFEIELTVCPGAKATST